MNYQELLFKRYYLQKGKPCIRWVTARYIERKRTNKKRKWLEKHGIQS